MAVSDGQGKASGKGYQPLWMAAGRGLESGVPLSGGAAAAPLFSVQGEIRLRASGGGREWDSEWPLNE